MRSYLIDTWIRVQASYWFTPMLMVLAAFGLSFLMVRLDAAVGPDWLTQFGWLYANQPEGARLLLSTVAGSMITVAGVTFSMTLLTVSHASSQIGPRLLSGFMRDRGNQITLGAFVSTFIYCLLVLRTVRAGSGEHGDLSAFVPHLAIVTALILALVSVIVLIYFIHHVPQSINMSNVINRVGHEMLHRIANLYPESLGDEVADETPPLPQDFQDNGAEICLEGDGGYLRVLDGDGLLKAACEADLILETKISPGEFAYHGTVLVRAYPAGHVTEQVKEDIRSVFSWGSERTPERDVLFLVDQLNEVAGKALSPGVNDPFSALSCMDQFERGIADLSRRSLPSPYRYDETTRLRVIAQPVGYGEFVDRILVPLRQFIAGDALASVYCLRMIKRVARARPNPEIRSRLVKHAELIADEGAECLPSSAQKQRVLEAMEAARRALAA